MTQQRLMDLAAMELGETARPRPPQALGELRAELEAVNAKIGMNPTSDHGIPMMSSMYKALGETPRTLLDEQDAIEARIDMIVSGCNFVTVSGIAPEGTA